MSEKTAILIAGPTASGKSATALRLARLLEGTVINADSMQVYADLRILTARPSPQEESLAPHLLYGHVDAARRHSVGAWLTEARQAAEEVWRQGRVPIFTGGTGLYFRALETGLAEIPPIPPQTREMVREMAGEGPEALRGLAHRLGLEHVPADSQRLLRALEVFLATGRELHAFHGTGRPALPHDARVVRVFIAPERDKLRQHIAERFHAMLSQGAVEETRRLLARRLPPDLPAMKAHGVRNIAAALNGMTSLEEAAQGAISETRQYAKRQMTWARKFMRHWHWVENPSQAAECALDQTRSLG